MEQSKLSEFRKTHSYGRTAIARQARTTPNSPLPARRLLLSLLPATLFFFATLTRGEEATQARRIAMVLVGYDQAHKDVQEFLRALEHAGLLPGRNVIIDWSSVNGDYSKLSELARAVVDRRPDMIIAENSTAALHLQRYTTTIPIVTVLMGDPIGSGLVKSLARPESNITGLSMMATDVAARRLQILSEIMPGLRRVGVLRDARIPTNMQDTTVRSLQEAASLLRVKLEIVAIKDKSEVEQKIASLRRRGAQALYVLESGFFSLGRPSLLESAFKAKLPVTSGSRPWAQEGALFTYSASLVTLWSRAAYYVERILKGAKPGDLPIEQPTKFEFVVNMKTAKRFGLKIPESVHIQATEILE